MTMLSIVFVGWTLIGVLAGAIIRPHHSGSDSPWVRTIPLGIGGALLGGVAACTLGYDISPAQAGGWIMSIFGAVALLSVAAFDNVIGAPPEQVGPKRLVRLGSTLCELRGPGRTRPRQ